MNAVEVADRHSAVFQAGGPIGKLANDIHRAEEGRGGRRNGRQAGNDDVIMRC
jgi:hypothetical protein